MPKDSTVHVGFVGAGAICRSRHLPGLGRIEGVRVVAVANRSRGSSQQVAADFAIPHVVDDWRQLVERDDIDAVFIGTWPYMHRDISLAALASGKHVFCQARMAMDLAEAKQMLAAAEAHRGLVNMVCPPPTRMPFEPYIKQMLASGKLGKITAVELLSVSGANLDANAVTWRERVEFSGKQALLMGIYAETLNAWLGPYETLSAHTATPVATKRDEQGSEVPIGIPQVMTIAGKLVGGAVAVEHHMGLAADKTTTTDRITVWGLKGTLRHRFLTDTIEYAPAGEPLRKVDVPAQLRRDWCVEADFIAAVRAAMRGEAWSVSPDFAEALRYMQKVEAVHLSALTGRAVNPSKL
ncbi:MAG: Gfo/Idh/MocA family oxidoreductase [Phycisphaeraceae bacterium]